MNEAEHLVETRRWLRYAREDLEGAEALLAQRVIIPRHICSLSQQAAEKAIKAILVLLALDSRRTYCSGAGARCVGIDPGGLSSPRIHN